MHRFRRLYPSAAGTALPITMAALLALPAMGLASPQGTWLCSPAEPPEPPNLLRHCAVYDAARDRMVLIGGAGTALAAWALPFSGAPVFAGLATAGTPPAWRQWFSAVYDPPGDRVIVYGGQTADSQINGEVWELALAGTPTWTELQPAGPGPGPRYHHAAAFDPVRRRMLVYGGGTSVLSGHDVWALSLDGPPAWSLVKREPAPSTGPSSGVITVSVAVYDSQRDRLVVYDDSRLFVDVPGSMWSLPLAGGNWEQLWNAGGSGSGYNRFSAVYDPGGDRVIFYGETDLTRNRVLEFSLASRQWTADSTGGTVQGRWECGYLYDPPRRRLVIHGGWAGNGPPLDSDYPVGTDCAALSLSGPLAWTRLAPPTPRTWPVPRVFATSAIDAARDRYIVFGGDGVSGFLGDAWATSGPPGSSWARLGAASGGSRPSPREFAAGFYDPVRDQLVILGGPRAFSTASPIDGWALPAATDAWVPLAFSGTAPFARQGHTVVYDVAHDRAILFGGIVSAPTSSQTYNDVWELRLDPTPAWLALAPSGTAPPTRAWHSAVYDPVRQRMLVFGGRSVNGTVGFNLDDVWALSLGDSPAWTPLAPSGGPVPIALYSRAAYDSDRDRILLLTSAGPGAPNPIWALDPVTAAWSPLAPDGTPPDGRVSPTMEYDQGRDELVVVFGGYPGPSDNDVWRLSYLTTVGVSPMHDAQLALAGVHPNPAGKELRVAFSLPDASAASLELFDLAGRRVLAREVGSLGAGSHVATLGEVRGLVPGLYVVRLAHGSDQRTARVIVTR